jgi:hypothetical protein
VYTMKIVLPLSVTLPRKTKADKVVALNLNVYRNTHYLVLNQAKIAYKEQVKIAMYTSKGVIKGGIWDGPYHFTYTVFPANNRAFDLANVLPIVQKFTDDALIELGFIKDDNWKVVRAVDYRFGGVDKTNPRVELEIKWWEV